MDFAMVGDAEATLVDGILTLRVDLRGGPGRPSPQRREARGAQPP